MTLDFSIQAEEDLIEIYSFGVANFGVEQAERYQSGLQKVFEAILNFPMIARERAEFTPAVRVHFHESHVIVYTATSENVFVVRVVGNRQDWAKTLQEDSLAGDRG
jgi:toxin ParE1/3/4